MAVNIKIILNSNQFTLDNNDVIIEDTGGVKISGKYSLKKTNEMLENYLKELKDVQEIQVVSKNSLEVTKLLPVLYNLSKDDIVMNEKTWIYTKRKEDK